MIQQLKNMSDNFSEDLSMFICMKSRQIVKLGCLEQKLMHSLEVMKLYEITVLIQSL